MGLFRRGQLCHVEAVQVGLVAFCHVEAVVVAFGRERLVTSRSGELS